MPLPPQHVYRLINIMVKKLYDVIVLVLLFLSPFAFLMKSGYEAFGVFFLLSNTFCGTAFYLLEVHHYEENTSWKNVRSWGCVFLISMILTSILSRVVNDSWNFVPKSGFEESGVLFLFFAFLVLAFGVFVAKALSCGRLLLFKEVEMEVEKGQQVERVKRKKAKRKKLKRGKRRK